MKPYLLPIQLTFLFVIIGLLYSCGDIIEPSIAKGAVTPEAPSDQYQSTSYSLNFWWDQVDNALTYRLQVVTPTFVSPGNLVLDTIIKKNLFAFTLNPGNYQWRVMAENGSSQTKFSTPRSFTVIASSIKQQSVLLGTPANNFLTNQNSAIFQWGNLYGAIRYRFEIDTNNFLNENTVVINAVNSTNQAYFTFPKDQIYQWRVRGENDTAQSQWSLINIVTYDHTPPVMVTLVSPAKGAIVNLPISLQWAASLSATKYKLYVLKSDSSILYNQNFPLQLTSTGYSFNFGNPGDKIYWKVTALDAAGNESTSSELRNFVLQ